MRLFVAVELEDHVRRLAAQAADAVRRVAGELDARWTPEDNLHITLVFLGDVPDEQVARVTAALEPAYGMQPFTIGIGGAGAFPSSGAPRVLWLGVRDREGRLAALYREVSARLEPLGFEPERRRYSAHLTIARVRDPRHGGGGRLALRTAFSAVRADAGESRVAAVTLFRSRLSPKGATYEPILRVPLGDR